MSTYLVAFIVGPLEATAPVDVGGIPLRLVHVPGKGHLAGFGLDVGAFALQWFQRYYGIPYPSDKVDLVALPDFAAGAMENLGCITFRESVLLVDPATATQTEEQLVADVVSHELAHMWFGDLVTMRWWNGIWLNEAFATFMEVAACDAFRPAWRRWETFGLERTAAFETDSLASTRPVEFEVVSPADADGMFDVLTYEKGGALLRMLEQYLGEERFRDGIRHYLSKHRFGNTETSDLWDALEATSGEPVRRIMDSWIWQEGYPLVTAALSDDGDEVILRQRRFLFGDELRDDGTPLPDTRWAIPVQIRQVAAAASPDAAVSATQEVKILLDVDERTVPLVSPDAVVVVNSGGHGFYRVAYDDSLRSRLAAAAQAATVHRGALQPSWTTPGRRWWPERPPPRRSAGWRPGFGSEPDVAVWRTLAAGLGWCDRLLDGEPRERFRAFVRELAGARHAGAGMAGGRRRGRPHRRAARPAHPDDGGARRRPRRPGPRRGVVRGVGGSVGRRPAGGCRGRQRGRRHRGPRSPTSSYVERFRAATTPQDQLRYLYALADFPDEDLMSRTLDFLLSPDVRTQNAPVRAGPLHPQPGPGRPGVAVRA